MNQQVDQKQSSVATITEKAKRPTRRGRIAWIVNDYQATKAALKKHFGMRMEDYDMGDFPLKVGIEEHGLEPLQPLAPIFADYDIRVPILEIALEVDDAEATKARLEKAGIGPVRPNYIPVSNTYEYHFGASGFHGIPIMVCTIGDNEADWAGKFGKTIRDIKTAPAPKLGMVTVEVDSIDKVAADFEHFYDMYFLPDNASGLGKRAVVGSHGVRLVEQPVAELRGHYPPPIVTTEIAVNDVEAVRRGFEKAGMPVLLGRKIKSGRKVYYFGNCLTGLPFGAYDIADDAEMRGVQSKNQ